MISQINSSFQDYKSVQFNDELYAHMCVENNEYPLNESKGIPDGLEDDSSYIAKMVHSFAKKNNWNDFEFNVDLSKLNLGNLFDSLHIKVKIISNNIEGGLDTSKLFTKDITINLLISKESSLLNIKTQIAHELIHAYVYVINKTTKSSDVSNYESQEDLIRFIVYALMYYFNDDELNAFIGELQIELKDKSPKNMRDAYRILYDSKIYQLWCDVYRAMNNGDKNLTNPKIKKRFDYIKRRLFRIVPRVIAESLYEGTVDHNPENFLRKLKEFRN